MRTSRRVLSVLAVASAAVSLGAAPARAALIGPTPFEMLTGMTWGTSTAINRGGGVAGAEGTADGCGTRAIRWDAFRATALSTPAGYWSRALAVSDTYTTVGFVAPIEPDGTGCRNPVPQATAWTGRNIAVPLASGYHGATVATSVNDIGEVVGLAIPEGSDPHYPFAVRFVDGQVVPLSTGDPLPMFIPEDLTRLPDATPGPRLTNLPSGNLVAGATSGRPAWRSYVVPTDGASFIPPGTVHWLGDFANAAAPTGISADGKTILVNADGSAVLWRWIYRSGHPTYKEAALAVPAGGLATGLSAQGGSVVGYGLTTGEGYVVLLATKATVRIPSARLTAVLDAGLFVGTDAQHRPAMWNFA